MEQDFPEALFDREQASGEALLRARGKGAASLMGPPRAVEQIQALDALERMSKRASALNGKVSWATLKRNRDAGRP